MIYHGGDTLPKRVFSGPDTKLAEGLTYSFVESQPNTGRQDGKPSGSPVSQLSPFARAQAFRAAQRAARQGTADAERAQMARRKADAAVLATFDRELAAKMGEITGASPTADFLDEVERQRQPGESFSSASDRFRKTKRGRELYDRYLHAAHAATRQAR